MGKNASKPPHASISDLPDNVMYAVFQLIDTIQLMPFSRVCKRWRRLIDDSRLRKVIDFSFICNPTAATAALHLKPILSNAPLLHTFKIAMLLTGQINGVIPLLVENCPHLSVFELKFCLGINEASWQLIGAAPWFLTHLSLHGCEVNDQVLATILPTVSQVTVNVIDEEICITEYIPSLRCLLLCYNNDITFASLVPLLHAVGPHLTQLSLSRHDCTLLAALPICMCLRVLALQLGDSPIDAVAGCLQRLTHLTHLRLTGGFYFNPGSDGLRGLFNVTREYPEYFELVQLSVEYLELVQLPVDNHVLEDIARTYGSHLRYLSIDSSSPITAVGLTEVANRCTAIEYFKLGFHRTSRINPDPAIAEVVSTMPHLRIFFIQDDERYVKDTLADIIPNVLVLNFGDERWKFPDISCTALQDGSFP